MSLQLLLSFVEDRHMIYWKIYILDSSRILSTKIGRIIFSFFFCFRLSHFRSRSRYKRDGILLSTRNGSRALSSHHTLGDLEITRLDRSRVTNENECAVDDDFSDSYDFPGLFREVFSPSMNWTFVSITQWEYNGESTTCGICLPRRWEFGPVWSGGG